MRIKLSDSPFSSRTDNNIQLLITLYIEKAGTTDACLLPTFKMLLGNEFKFPEAGVRGNGSLR